jgi:SRSO17 transposase
LPASAWRRLSAGAGTKGERLHDWAYLELADLDGGEYSEALAGQEWTRGLLIRRKIVDGGIAFFTTWAPRGTTIERLAKIEGHRWAIEDSFETTKNELGLDHNETRSWHGWRRHVSLVMLGFAMMAAIRVHAAPKNDAAQGEDAPSASELMNPSLIRWSTQEIRRIANRLARKRIRPQFVIAWSLWRRAHQAQARRAHIKSQL